MIIQVFLKLQSLMFFLLLAAHSKQSDMSVWFNGLFVVSHTLRHRECAFTILAYTYLRNAFVKFFEIPFQPSPDIITSQGVTH